MNSEVYQTDVASLNNLEKLQIEENISFTSLPVCIAQPRPRPPALLWPVRPAAPQTVTAAPAMCQPPSAPGSPNPGGEKDRTFHNGTHDSHIQPVIFHQVVHENLQYISTNNIQYYVIIFLVPDFCH